jgi:hypothetical protein
MCYVRNSYDKHTYMYGDVRPSVHLFIPKFQADNCMADFDYTGNEIYVTRLYPKYSWLTL